MRSKLTIKTPKRSHLDHYGVFIVNILFNFFYHSISIVGFKQVITC